MKNFAQEIAFLEYPDDGSWTLEEEEEELAYMANFCNVKVERVGEPTDWGFGLERVWRVTGEKERVKNFVDWVLDIYRIGSVK